MSQCPSCGGICKKSGCERTNPVGKFAKFTDGIWREVTDGSPGIFLYTASPQRTEQEPVAWMFQHDETGRMNYVSNDGIHNPTMFLEMNPRYALVCPLHTSPPQRTWVGLTDDEKQAAYIIVDGWSNCVNFIEKTLREKNK